MSVSQTISNLTGLKYEYCDKTFKGGYVMEPQGPFYKDVFVLDFKRFYPHIIICNNLFEANLSSYLKTLLDSSLNDTGEAKKESKIRLNSIYGMMKHFDFGKAQSCAEKGREYIQLAINIFKEQGFKVVSADTDSLTIVFDGSSWEINYCINKIKNIMSSTCPNYIDSFKLEIENHFKYVYYFKRPDGSFKKKQYIGVRYDDSIVLKSRKLNKDEQLAWGFIASKLRDGISTVKEKEMIEYCEKVFHTTKRFINIENISILGIDKSKVIFNSNS